VLLEAMYCGTPPISFELRVGTGCIINDGVNGFIVPQRNDDDYAEKVIALLERDGGEMEEMGKRCVERAMDFSKEKVVELWLRLFREAL